MFLVYTSSVPNMKHHTSKVIKKKKKKKKMVQYGSHIPARETNVTLVLEISVLSPLSLLEQNMTDIKLSDMWKNI